MKSAEQTPSTFLTGINYPWVHYGWDFGDPPLAWIGGQPLAEWRAQKRQQIADDFREFARLGISAVRWFLLADGLNYGIGDDAPQTDGSEWNFYPLPARHPFHAQLGDDFAFVMKTCAELKLKLLPSLMDFHWCFPAVVVDQKTGVIKGGRSSVVTDPEQRAQYFENVLELLLTISLRNPETIYAWELINEPEWVTKRGGLRLFGRRNDEKQTVPHAAMIAFITEGIARINAKKLPDGRAAFASTVGFATWKTISEWKAADLGITLNQFHYYAQDNQALPENDFSDELPCCVGEFATAAGMSWPELVNNRTDQTIASRLRAIADKGHQSTFLWSARATDQATTWTEAEHQEIAGYLRPSPEGSA